MAGDYRNPISEKRWGFLFHFLGKVLNKISKKMKFPNLMNGTGKVHG